MNSKMRRPRGAGAMYTCIEVWKRKLGCEGKGQDRC